MSKTVSYAKGRDADVYGDGPVSVLLWHGSAANYRHVMAPLAQAIASHGLTVMVPDWSKETSDRGHGDLLASVRFARKSREEAKLDADALVLVAWSLGGTAALSLALHHEKFGFKFKAAVLLAAPANVIEPITGSALTENFPSSRTVFEVVHGRNDTVVDPGDSLQIVQRLKAAGNRNSLTLLGADHGSIVMAEHNVIEDSYAPADTAETRVIGESVASIVASHASKR